MTKKQGTLRLGLVLTASSAVAFDPEADSGSTRAASKLLQNSTLLSSDSSTLALDILDPGKLEPICAALSQQGAPQHSALLALEALSCDSVNCYYISCYGGGAVVRQLYSLLGTLGRESSLFHAIFIIANLASNLPTSSALTDSQGISAIVRLLEQPPTTRVLSSATSALAHLAFAPACRVHILRARAVEPLLAAATAPGLDADCRITALTALKRLAAGDERACGMLVQAGAVVQLEEIAARADVTRECRSLAGRLRDMLTSASGPPTHAGAAASRPIHV